MGYPEPLEVYLTCWFVGVPILTRVQILEAVDSGPPEIAHMYLDNNLSMDDFMWQQAVSSYHFVVSKWNFQSKTPDESILYHFLRHGLLDVNGKLDNAFPISIRTMRYTACAANHLWTLLEQERLRVGLGIE